MTEITKKNAEMANENCSYVVADGPLVLTAGLKNTDISFQDHGSKEWFTVKAKYLIEVHINKWDVIGLLDTKLVVVH
ncbi:hypothetical protein, partial [Lactococcus petauri]|uniref:hypothetical protein n=1 Tax=Lactococcus petauri TaxID=1940789 RepID=UPI0021F1819C